MKILAFILPLLFAVILLESGTSNQKWNQQRPNDSRIKPRPEHPVMNLPIALRQQNWVAASGDGSCVWASLVMALRWQHRDQEAAHLRATYSGGASKYHTAKCGIRLAETFNERDVGFLEWAVRTRRGACVAIQGAEHMVCIVDMTEDRVAILDNNDPNNIHWRWRKEFLADWFKSASWAITPLGPPPPPLLY